VTFVSAASAQSPRDTELQVIKAVDLCVEQWGWDKVTMDDICDAAGVSRATLYRMFPGGRDVLFEAVRVHHLEEFFTAMRAHVEGATSLEDLLVRCIVVASTELRHDQHLTTMLATAPGETVGELTLSGLDRIVRVATSFITPLTDAYIDSTEAAEIVDVMCRLVISYFLSPSKTTDFTNEDTARRFIRNYLLPTRQIFSS